MTTLAMEEVGLLGENLDISTLEELLRQARSRDEGSNEQPEDIHEVIPLRRSAIAVEIVNICSRERFARKNSHRAKKFA